MPYEEDIRSAFRTLADQAPEASDVLTAVTERRATQALADRSGRRPARIMHSGWPDRRARRRLVVLAAPAAAVAGVVAVIVATVAVSGAPHAGRSPAMPRGAVAELPPYYMVMGKLLVPNRYSSLVALEAVIRDTATSKTAAVVRLPRPYVYISDISGAADDKSFVLAGQTTEAYGQGATAFFIARFDPANRDVAVEPLRIPKVMAPARHVEGIALSPDGSRVAIALGSVHKDGSHYVLSSEISVYSLADGSVRTWTAAVGLIGMFFAGPIDPSAMSWSLGGLLAFNGAISSSMAGDHIWLLNTATAGGSLLADSHYVVDLTGHGVWNPSGEGIVTLDGTKVVAPVYRNDARHQETITINGRKERLPEPLSQVDEFSATTGRTMSQLHPVEPYFQSVFWANSSGSVLVISVQHQGSQQAVLGVLAGNRFSPLPGAPRVLDVPQYPVAF
jgi:hypothetical protein